MLILSFCFEEELRKNHSCQSIVYKIFKAVTKQYYVFCMFEYFASTEGSDYAHLPFENFATSLSAIGINVK